MHLRRKIFLCVLVSTFVFGSFGVANAQSSLSLSLSSGVASFVSSLSSSLGDGLASLENFFVSPKPVATGKVAIGHAVIPPQIVQAIQQQPVIQHLQPIEQITKNIVEEKVITNVITHETQTTKVVDNSASVANDLLSIQGDITALKNQLNALNTSPGNINVTNVYQSGGNNLNLHTLSSGAIELSAAQGVYINGGAVSIGASPPPGEAGIVQITNNTNVIGNLKIQNSDNTSSTTITPTSFTLGNANTFNLDSSGNLTVGGTLTVTGATTLSSTLAVTGATTLSSTLGVSGLITAASGATLTAGDLAITAGNLTLGGITRISNVGVGTFITGTAIATQTFTTNNIADSGALTIKSGGANSLTLDTAGAAAINIGNTNAASVALGNITTNPTLTLLGTGATTLGGNLAVNGGSITTTQAIANLFNAIATTLNIGGASTTLALGANTGTATINNATTDLAGNLTFTGVAARTITGPTTGGLTINDTTGNLTLSTTTSGTLAATSAGALNLTGNAASTWQNSGGTLTIQTTSQNLTLQTVTSGTLAVTSAGVLTFTGGATSTWSTSAGNLNIQSAGTLNLSTTASNSAITLAPNGTGSVQLTSGATTGTAALSGLSIAANGLTSGTGENISSSSTGLTTAGANVGSLINATTSGAFAAFTGNLVNISMSGASAAGNTGTLLNINDAGAANLTTLLTLNSSSTVNTSSLMSLTSATTAAPTNGIIRFNFNGARTTAGNGFQIDDVSTTLATAMAINANSLTTGIGLSILNTGTALTTAGVNTGSLLNINASGATAAFTGSLVNINFAGAAVANTGALLNINSSGAAQLTQSILVTNASTGAPSNGLIRFNFTGAHTGNGFQIDDATQTGAALALGGSAITTGKLLSVSTGSNNTWTGNGTTNGLINLASSSTAGTASASSILLNLSRSGANSNTAHTAYGIYSSVTNTNATSGTNIAGYFSASGATTANYGLIVASGNAGIGTTSPAGLLDISGALSAAPSATVGNYLSLSASTLTDNATAGSGTATGATFNSLAQDTLAASNTSVTTTNAYGLYLAGAPTAGTNETLTNTTALTIAAGAVAATTTNSYALRVNAQTGATHNYAAAFVGGNVGIGTISPTAFFSVGTASQFQLDASGNLTTSGTIATTNNTASTTTSTGALVVTGGVGIGGALNVGSTGTFSSTLTAASYTRSCPTGYVVVPGNPKFGTTDFCVMKYPASNDGSGNAVSVATNTPYVSIDQTDSETKCQAASAHLITENEWMTIAENALFQNANWCSSDGSACGNAPGTVGKILAAGHNDSSPNQALAASTNDSQACFGTVTAGVDTTCGSAGTQKRTLTLSNGSVVWDIGGNVWEWTDSWIFGSEEPTTATPGFGWREFTAITRWQALNYANPSAQGWNSTQGLGQIYSDGTSTNTTLYGFIRGGGWNNGADAGAVALDLAGAPSSTNTNIGFRCAR